MSVIYEVNIRVANDICQDYVTWLKHHINDMLQLDGFEKATISINDELKFSEIVVHYSVTSRNDLEHYFTHQAENMRKHAKELFGEQFSITRRILTILSHKEFVDE